MKCTARRLWVQIHKRYCGQAEQVAVALWGTAGSVWFPKKCHGQCDGGFRGKHAWLAVAEGRAEFCPYLIGGASEVRRFAAADCRGCMDVEERVHRSHWGTRSFSEHIRQYIRINRQMRC
jgi:hypothetical protein